ncbi:hypothetical protein LTR84_010496 [Exophiala bonariae]|uniref:Cytochrome c domain-containing protein n=1 Tax=Exophiala bonariae TaxID=1690606 RepID=A0AAV9MSX1_9EURO|nr:hypothetical protein LTR84_010496 [Exophiala bonariae]
MEHTKQPSFILLFLVMINIGLAHCQTLLPWTCNSSVNTLEDLEALLGTVPTHCYNELLLPVLTSNYAAALEAFQGALGREYDDNFETYKHYMEKNLPRMLQSYVWDNSSQYFNCFYEQSDQPQPYCLAEGVGKAETAIHGIPEWLEFKDDNKEAEFYKSLEQNFGLNESDLIFGEHQQEACTTCHEPNGDLACCPHVYKMRNWPMLRSDYVVMNPKSWVDQQLPSLVVNLESLKDAIVDIDHGTYVGNIDELIDAYKCVVAGLERTKNSMEVVKDVAAAIAADERRKKEELILQILLGVLTLLPFLGQATAALTGVSVLARLASIIGGLGGTAVTVVQIVNNPELLLQTIFESMFQFARLGRGAPGRAALLRNAAEAARKLGPKEAEQLFGATQAARIATISRLTVKCM